MSVATVSLRIGTPLWEHPARLEELLALAEEFSATVTEVAFFTGFTHPPLPLATIERRAEALAAIMPRFRALGVTAGINHLSTLGHLDENLENSLREPWQRLVDLRGSVSASCYCPSDPDMQAYLRRSYRALAQARPDFLWVDDDVRLEHHPPGATYACFCSRCLARFADETGQTWTREALCDTFNAGARAERLALRRQWLAHNRAVIGDLLALIRAAVDEVHPELPLGLMTGEMVYSGLDFPGWAAALAGPRGVAVKWRPGGGFYQDDRPLEALGKAHSVGRQTALLPEDIRDVQYEHENFPYQRLKKSVRLFSAEIAAAIGAGCTGVALNILSAVPTPLIEEYRPLFVAVDERKAWYDEMVSTFGRTACEGIWAAFTPDQFAVQHADGEWDHGQPWGTSLWGLNELSEIGLPFAYSADGARVTLATGDTALDADRETWLARLAGGVLLDGPALARLHEMGLGAYLGFAPAGTLERDTIEQFTDDPLNGRFAGWQRDCRPSFYPSTTFLVEPAALGARIISRVVNFTPTDLGAVAGVYENALGGRVAVLGYYPWHSLGSLMKTSQLKALTRWLSHDTLPAYLESFHRAALWCRRDQQGRPALLVLNASLDDVEGVALRIRDLTGALRVIRREGVCHLPSPTPDDSPYIRVTLPPLAPWEAALVTAG